MNELSLISDIFIFVIFFRNFLTVKRQNIYIQSTLSYLNHITLILTEFLKNAININNMKYLYVFLYILPEYDKM